MYSQSQARNRQYRVRLGHAEVTVRCPTAEEALRLARRQLSLLHPRLWDVIYRAQEDRFRISTEE